MVRRLHRRGVRIQRWGGSQVRPRRVKGGLRRSVRSLPARSPQGLSATPSALDKMSAAVATGCEPLCLLLPDLPPRGRLYSLEPVGVDTPEVESLSSYIVRLAEEHSVTVGTLFRQELMPNLPVLGSGIVTSKIRY